MTRDWDSKEITELIDSALREDVGAGDITSNVLFPERRDKHTGRFAGTRCVEGDPSSIRRQPRVPDRPFGALEQLALVSGFRIEERNRVQARKPFDDEPAFIHPLARPPAAVHTQLPPRPVGHAGEEDWP